jgi:hypothetical protein
VCKPGTASTRRYCSHRCRQAAYRQRFERRIDAKVAEAMQLPTSEIWERFERDIERIKERGRAEHEAEKKAKHEARHRANLVRAAARGDADAITELKKLMPSE